MQMGIALVIGSALVIIVTFTYRPLITNNLVSIPLGVLPQSIVAASADALAGLADMVFQPMLIEAIALALLGVLLIVVGSRPVTPKAEKTASEVEEEV